MLIDMIKFWENGGHFNYEHYSRVLEAKVKQLNNKENESDQEKELS